MIALALQILSGRNKPGNIIGIGIAFLLLIPDVCYPKNSVKVSFQYEGGVSSSIVVDGKINSKMWLGVSLYPVDTRDAVKEGKHSVREIKKGNFMETFSIDANYNGSYEIALWNKKIDCKADTSYWCEKYGFYLNSLAFYHAGYFNDIREK